MQRILGNSVARSAVSLLLLSGWLVALFAGFAAGGAVHLLLAGALALFPWRARTPSEREALHPDPSLRSG